MASVAQQVLQSQKGLKADLNSGVHRSVKNTSRRMGAFGMPRKPAGDGKLGLKTGLEYLDLVNLAGG